MQLKLLCARIPFFVVQKFFTFFYTPVTPNSFSLASKSCCTTDSNCVGSGRSSNLLRSVYQLHGCAGIGRVLQNYESGQNGLPSIPSCKLDKMTTYLK